MCVWFVSGSRCPALLRGPTGRARMLEQGRHGGEGVAAGPFTDLGGLGGMDLDVG
jgi:hypothetical protein